MERLKNSIIDLGRKNVGCKWFVPHQALYDLMTEAAVRDAICDTNLEKYRNGEITKAIMNGARKIFTILILIGQPQSILKFIEDDQLQHRPLDHKLPFQHDKLKELLDVATAKLFHERQWEFTAPVFLGSVLPRVLEDEVILPFVESREIGHGGFGVVHAIKIEPSHQRFDQFGWIAKKEFRTMSDGDIKYERELRNLSMLKLLKHPNIVELLGCYTYRGRHNFLFPIAQGGTLADLLEGERPLCFQSDESLIIALSELSSAVCSVHEFAAEDLKAIGCHHDLKPSNILVDGPRFILADFGLSRFKELSQTSWTTFKEGRGEYLAPECEDLGGDFEKYAVRRSSDIWSFGCIIAELLVYITQGAKGVCEFKKKRAFKIENVKFFRFHCGPGKPNNSVVDWLVDIEEKSVRPGQLLVPLVKQMLSLKPEDRPAASEVEGKLRFVAIKSVAQSIELLYNAVCERSKSVQAMVERARFSSWTWASGMLDISDDGLLQDLPSWRFSSIFQSVLRHLLDIRASLREVELDCQDQRRRLFSPLRHLNNILLAMLPQEVQDRARTHLEVHLLQTQDSQVLVDMSVVLHGSLPNDRLGMLAAVKRVSILVAEHSALVRPGIQIDPRDLHDRADLNDFYVCRVADAESRSSSNALVEWKNYGEHCSDELIGRELLVRLEAVTELLNAANKPNEFRVLHCRGFYHDPAHYAFGLVFDFPSSSASGGESLCVTTLREMLEKRAKDRQFPLLGDRFRLAHDLATSVLEFHKVSWLQKSISSFNIAFFHPRGSRWSEHMNRFYFLGFLQSRPNEDFAFTEGPPEDAEHKDYQHPNYVQNNVRFRPEFDYYSLGLVLLEIGLWEHLSDLTRGWGGTPEKFREKLLKSRIPLLGETMGVIYRDAVSACLRGGFDAAHVGDGTSSSLNHQLSFERLVVNQLAKCTV